MAAPKAPIPSCKWSSLAQKNQKRKDDKDKGIVAAPKEWTPRNNANAARFVRKQTNAPIAVPIALREFNFSTHMQMEPKRGGKPAGPSTNGRDIPPMINLRNPTQGPLCVTATGGGSIHPQFGVSISEYGQTRMQITFDDPVERNAWTMLASDLGKWLEQHAKECYPEEIILKGVTHINPILSEAKPKPGGPAAGMYEQLAAFNINDFDLLSAHGRAPELVILDENKRPITNFQQLPGTRWTFLTIELQRLILGRNQKKGELPTPLVTLNRRVRALDIKTDETIPHFLFPEDVDVHNAETCKRPHHVPIHAKDFVLSKHMRIEELKKMEGAGGTEGAKVTGGEQGGEVLIKLCGGGTLPPFVVSWSEKNKNWRVSLPVESKLEEDALDSMYEQFQNLVVENRNKFFPRKKEDNAWVRSQCKKILGKVSRAGVPEYSDHFLGCCKSLVGDSYASASFTHQ